MADYLLGLTQRTLGVAETLQPLIPSLFEAGPPMASDPVWDWQAEPPAETAVEPNAVPLTHHPKQAEAAIAPSNPSWALVYHSDLTNFQPSALPDPRTAEFTRNSDNPSLQEKQPHPVVDGREPASTEKKKG